MGSCSSTPTTHCSSRGSIDRLQLAAVAKESLDRVQLTAIDRSALVTRSLQCNRSGSVGERLARVQLEPNASHPRACVYERNAHRSAPNTHRNREHPDIFLALASTTVFSVMDGPKMSCSCVSGPARMKSPFFVIEVGAHHIYDDTGFCHNHHHRSVISMTEKFVRPKMSRMCLFFVVIHT